MAVKVFFFGSSEFSMYALDSLIDSRYNILGVYTRAPKISGRGLCSVKKTCVHSYAESKMLRVFTPASLSKRGEEMDFFFHSDVDLVVVSSYGLIFPESVLKHPKFGCMNVHPSLLPRWRGATPISSALLAGDKVAGVSLMMMDSGVDSGDLVMVRELDILKLDHVLSLQTRLGELSYEMLVTFFADWDGASNVPIFKQSEEGVTLCNKETHFEIDWNNNAEFVNNKIKAYYPKVYCNIRGCNVKILQADSFPLSESKNHKFYFRCGGESILVPKILQKSGRKPCTSEDFFRGFRV